MKGISTKSGFTLIELLVVIAIIALLSTTVMGSLSRARQKSRDATRLSDMRQIQTALEMYYNDHSGYPVVATWNSECVAYGGVASNAVIPGIIPTYMARFPTDPMMDKTNNKNCYLYYSNGADYKLLDHDCPDCNYPAAPTFLDPTRDGGTDACTLEGTSVWAWAVWSSATSRCW